MSAPKVVHKMREPYDVYVGRPSKWGNPFFIVHENDREIVIEKYKRWIAGRADLLAALPELRGKVLACWCSPKACHADVLLEMANNGGVS